MSQDLFEQARQDRLEQEAPLAARMRPRTLDEFVGQEAIIGPGRLLRRAIQADQLSSLIFYGPPGTGKTTLARVIANTTQAHFIALNAVLAGVKDIRAAIDTAKEYHALHGQRTILFVDEVHRFNKAQQDALLPWVENGTVIFIGATTENPYFEVNKALVSRSRIFQLKPLTEDHLRIIAQRTLADPERGYGKLNVTIDEEALDHLVDVANGDARALLNALELAVETTAPVSSDGGRPQIHITLDIAEESIQRRAVLYDKEGDYHFDTISAFIKSLRGSDPDAAMYWLAKMIYAGEDPRFIFRRMLIFASEDVGLADPNAVQVVSACAQSFDRVGLPEGNFPLAQAALYLATAPKSNSVFAFFDALGVVRDEPEGEVPNHLKDANRDKEGFGHGEGYLYPHAYREHWVAQQYLPDSLQGKVFYQPSDQGYESNIRDMVARRREAQLAAMLEASEGPGEILTFSPRDAARDRWLQRTISGTGERLAAIRDRLFELAQLPRHGVALDINAGSGLLTWEAIRHVPEGGVFALVRSLEEEQALREQASALPALDRPIILRGQITELPALLAEYAQGDPLRFDAVLGRNSLLQEDNKSAALEVALSLLTPSGVMVLAEQLPRHSQRLYALLDLTRIDPDLAKRLVEAEEAIYEQPEDPMVNWDETTLRNVLDAITEGIAATEGKAWEGKIAVDVENEVRSVRLSRAVLQRWFTPGGSPRPSYVDRLADKLTVEEIDQIRDTFFRQLANQTVDWHSRMVYVYVRKA